MNQATLPLETHARTATQAKDRLVRVALPVPLGRGFDYRIPAGMPAPQVGARVSVPFGRGRKLVGVVTDRPAHSDVQANKLKDLDQVLDSTPVVAADILELARFASGYYHHPLGGVLEVALPAALRRQSSSEGVIKRRFAWRRASDATPDDDSIIKALARAPKQQALYDLLAHGALEEVQLVELFPGWRPLMRALKLKGLVEQFEPDLSRQSPAPPGFTPTGEQEAAVEAVCGKLGAYHSFLLNGVTGSGKTEVYIRCLEAVLARGEQALVLVPEIGQTPQNLRRLRERLAGRIASLHSGLSDGERASTYLRCNAGEIDVLIGTRSAIWVSLPRLGLIIVDEEHDTSFKQQDALRYHARDLAHYRASRRRCPIVLGSATPSLESLHKARAGRLTELRLTQRATGVAMPKVEVVSTLQYPLQEGGLTVPVLEAIQRTLDRGEQALLFLNRRGFAPVLKCRACGSVVECSECSVSLTYHDRRKRCLCHHCGLSKPVPKTCRSCKADALEKLGDGTERVEHWLQKRFPRTPLVRFDRDTTRRQGSMETMLDSLRTGGPAIVVGTQMIAGCHHLPGVTLSVLLNADQALCYPDVRSSETFGQLFTQVCGRSGRESPGLVLVQSRHPDSPYMMMLIQHGYGRFAELLLGERKEADMPPFTHLAVMRFQAVERDKAEALGTQIVNQCQLAGVRVCGPAPCIIERMLGRYRFSVLFSSHDRRQLHRLVGHAQTLAAGLDPNRQVRVALDIDPAEIL